MTDVYIIINISISSTNIDNHLNTSNVRIESSCKNVSGVISTGEFTNLVTHWALQPFKRSEDK